MNISIDFFFFIVINWAPFRESEAFLWDADLQTSWVIWDDFELELQGEFLLSNPFSSLPHTNIECADQYQPLSAPWFLLYRVDILKSGWPYWSCLLLVSVCTAGYIDPILILSQANAGSHNHAVTWCWGYWTTVRQCICRFFRYRATIAS